MHTAQIVTTASTLVRKMFAAVAIGAVATTLLAAGTAQAQPKDTGPAKGCLIENNGKLETVPVGSKVGLFTCGSDGEWHFGWLINAISAPPQHKTLKPVVSGAIQHGVLQAAKARR